MQCKTSQNLTSTSAGVNNSLALEIGLGLSVVAVCIVMNKHNIIYRVQYTNCMEDIYTQVIRNLYTEL